MQNQKTGQNSTGSGSAQKLVLPQVRYHPSIQMPVGGARPKTTNNTRTTQTHKTRSGAAGPPQTRTNTQVVQKNRNAVKPRPYGGQKQKPAAGPEPPQKPGAGPERPQKPGAGPERPQKPGAGPERPQKAAAGPEPPQKQAQASDRASPRPEQFPPRVGEHLDRCVVEKVEVLTRGQRNNPDWFAWRKNRITASVAHRIANSRFVNGKSKTPPTSYLAAVTGEGRRVQTRAMSWGIQNEARAVRSYQELKSAALRRQVSVRDCGLFIDAQRPWLAASPDGIVTDSRTGRWLLCLEVKCPDKHKDRRVEEACREDRYFCLELQDEDRRKPGEPPKYRLKASHSYFTQIQCQLAVTGLQEADLVVFTLKETAVVPVRFDRQLWDEKLSKLELFYRDAVQPHISQKTQQEAAAAWTPEL